MIGNGLNDDDANILFINDNGEDFTQVKELELSNNMFSEEMEKKLFDIFQYRLIIDKTRIRRKNMLTVKLNKCLRASNIECAQQIFEEYNDKQNISYLKWDLRSKLDWSDDTSKALAKLFTENGELEKIKLSKVKLLRKIVNKYISAAASQKSYERRLKIKYLRFQSTDGQIIPAEAQGRFVSSFLLSTQQNLETLNFSNLNMSQDYSEQYQMALAKIKFKQLKVLILKNCITKTPEYFNSFLSILLDTCQFTLEELNFANHQRLPRINQKTQKSYVVDKPKLTALHFKQIALVFEKVQLPKLKVINFSENSISNEVYPNLLKQLSISAGNSLQIINLKNTQMCQEAFQTLQESFLNNQLQKIQILILSNNSTANFQQTEIMPKFFESLQKVNSTLKILDISAMDLNNESLISLANSFEPGYFVQLYSLNLSDNTLLEDTLQLILKNLSKTQPSSQLKELLLQNTKFNDKCAAYIADLLQLFPNLTHIQLNKNIDLSQDQTNIGFQLFSEKLGQSMAAQLKILSLQQMDLKEKFINIITNTFQQVKFSQLEEVYFDENNNIEPQSYENIIKSLGNSSSTSLKIISFKNIKFSEECLTSISKSLEQTKFEVLEDFQISHNLNQTIFTPQLLESLFKGLAHAAGHSLQIIDLSEADLNEEKAIILSNIFINRKNFSNVRLFSIKQNQNISVKGFDRLLNSLGNCAAETLQELNFQNCNIGDKAAEKITKFFKENKFKKLIMFNISKNENMNAQSISSLILALSSATDSSQNLHRQVELPNIENKIQDKLNNVFRDGFNFPKLTEIYIDTASRAAESAELLRCLSTVWGENLVKIDASKMGWSDLYVNQIYKVLKQVNFQKLQSFDCSGAGINIQNFDDFLASIQQSMKTSLQEINLKRCQISEIQVKQIIKLIDDKTFASGNPFNLQVDSAKFSPEMIETLNKYNNKADQNQQQAAAQQIQEFDFQTFFNQQDIMKKIIQQMFFNTSNKKLLRLRLFSSLMDLAKGQLHASILIFSMIKIDWKEDVALVEFINKLSRSSSTLYFGQFLFTLFQKMFIKPLNCKNIHTYILNNEFFAQSDKFNFKQINFMHSHVMQIFKYFPDNNNKLIFMIWDWAKCSKIQKIYLEYEFINFEKISSWSEKQILRLFAMIPPTSINFYQTNRQFSISFYKSLLSILSMHPYLDKVQININLQVIENTSIAYYIKNHACYRIKFDPQMNKFIKPGCIKNFMKRFFYIFFRLLQGGQFTYKIDKMSLKLEQDLQSSDTQNFQYLKIFILFIIPIYLLVSIFFPVYFTYKEGLINENGCEQGISNNSYGPFGGFVFITILIEAYLYKETIDRVGHLIPGIVISVGQNPIDNLVNWFKRQILNFSLFDYKYFLYAMAFGLSQLARYTYFADIQFILRSLYQCSYATYTGFISLIIVSIFTGITIIKYIKCLILHFSKDYHPLPMSQIQSFYELSVLIEFQALSDVLDKVSCYNVVKIPFFDRPISQGIFNIFVRVLVKNVPQVVLQMIFLISNPSTSQNYQEIAIIISILANILQIFISILQLLQLRPSIITQLDFNETVRNQKYQLKFFIQDKIKQEQEQVTAFFKGKRIKQLKECFQNMIDRRKLNQNIVEPGLNLELYISNLLKEHQINIQWKKQTITKYQDNQIIKNFQILQTNYLKPNESSTLQIYKFLSNLDDYIQFCEQCLVDTNQFTTFYNNKIKFEFRPIDNLCKYNDKGSEIILKRKSDQQLFIALYDQLSYEAVNILFRYKTMQKNNQLNLANMRYIAIYVGLHDQYQQEDELRYAKEIEFYMIKDKTKMSQLSWLYWIIRYPFYIIINSQNQIQYKGTYYDLHKKIMEFSNQVIQKEEEFSQQIDKNQYKLLKNLQKQLMKVNTPQEQNQQVNSSDILNNNILDEIKILQDLQKLVQDFSISIEKQRPYTLNVTQKNIQNKLVYQNQLKFKKVQINYYYDKKDKEIIEQQLSQCKILKPEICNIQSGLITFDAFIGTQCSLCQVELTKDKPQYFCYDQQQSICCECAEKQKTEKKEDESPFVYPYKLIFINVDVPNELLMNLDIYKFGKEQPFHKYSIRNQKSTSSVIICNGCRSKFRNGIRFICLNCRKGPIQKGGYVDFCENCQIIHKTPKHPKQADIIEKNKEYDHQMNHLLLRIPVKGVDNYYTY